MSTPLPRWEQRDNFRRDPHQALVDRCNETHSITPAGDLEVRRTPYGTTVLDRRERQRVGDTFPARLGAATQDGSNKRWTYDFAEVEKTSVGYDGWAEKTGGRSGTAYNRIEEMNGATGLYGNGVDSDNLVTGFDIKEAPGGVLVEMAEVTVAGEEPEYWFSYENGVDGTCEAEE
jgi:hypothetical protein